MADTDARPMNWRFVVPSEPRPLLHLGPEGSMGHEGLVEPSRDSEGLLAALTDATYEGVAVSDLAGWARLVKSRPAGLLRRLRAATAPGGWIFVAVPNALSPRRPAASGSMTLAGSLRALRAAGFTDVETYVLLPDERTPAYLVSAADPSALAHLLGSLFLPYVPGDRVKDRIERRALSSMRWLAMRAPHRARLALAPGFGFVARAGA